MSGYEDWLSCLPDDVQKRQRAWDRAMLFLRLHEAGMKQIDIARMHGLSQARGWQLIQVARRRKEMRERSPAELWCLHTKWETSILPKREFDRLKEFMRPMKLEYQPPPCPPYQGPPIVWGSVDS